MQSDRYHRLNYHPVPWEQGRPKGSRKVAGRWSLISGHCDLDGATVLDLGCSGAYMSFRAAETAARVVGVDADAEIIERNRGLAAQRGLDNISFVHGRLSPELILDLPRADFAFFLSVFHHMLVGSAAYDWNPEATQAQDVGRMMVFVFFYSGQAQEPGG